MPIHIFILFLNCISFTNKNCKLNICNIFWIRVSSYFFTSLGSYKNWSLFLFAVLDTITSTWAYVHMSFENVSQKSRLLEIKMSFHIEFQHINSLKSISLIFLLVVNLEIDSITAKPYMPQKSWFQWICSKFFVLWHGHDYFWPPRLWRLLEAKNVIASAHFGTLTQRSVHQL